MRTKEIIMQSVPRKIIAAVITSVLFSVLCGLVQPDPFGEEILSKGQYIEAFLLSTSVYLIFSLTIILIYGSLTSIVSDLFSSRIIKNKSQYSENYLSLFFHLVFGLILLWISLVASIIYFLVDRYLRKRKSVYKWCDALKSFMIPLFIWILFMGVIWVVDFLKNWTDFVVW